MKTRLPIFVLFAVAAGLPAQQTGEAVFYSDRFVGKPMANGARFDQRKLTVSHASLPFGSEVRVTDLETGASVVVEVTDRPGPKTREVAILTRAAAERLGFVDRGRARVRLEPLTAREPAVELAASGFETAPREAAPAEASRAEAAERRAIRPSSPPAERAPAVQRPPRPPLPAGRKPSPFSLSEPN